MRYTNRLSIVTVALAAAGSAAVVVAAFVVVGLMTGGGDDEAGDVVEAVETSDAPTLQELLDSTPRPPTGPVPTHDPNLPGGFSVPTRGVTPTPLASLEVSGVVIPVPEGAHYLYGGAAETLEAHWIQLGDSAVAFDDYGLAVAGIEASDRVPFEPTLDAIWTLTQEVGTPSPPSLVVHGVDIPLPQDSYYGHVVAQSPDETVVRYYVRFEHSVLSFDHWDPGLGRGLPVTNAVRPADKARFQPTLDALGVLAP